MIALALVLLCTGGSGHEVSMREVDGDLVCSVRASDASVRALVEEIGAQLGRRVVGFDDLPPQSRVTVQLTDRPTAQVLRYVLGAAGLRARLTQNEIAVESELPPFATYSELADATQDAYYAALVHFPDHATGAAARLALGELEAQRGRPERAAQHFDQLVEGHPDSELVPEALWQAGRNLQQTLAYSEARRRFVDLANLQRAHPYHAAARLELARCLVNLGDGRQALFVLDGLERAYPPEGPEQADRAMVRAQAEGGSGLHTQALRTLEQATALDPNLLLSMEAMELRARALERAGRPSDAAIAWIAFSRDPRTPNARRALKEAARLALAAEGQELAVIFVHGLAQERGFGDELLGELAQARGRLGLSAQGLGEATALERLQRGELLLADGVADAARSTLEGALALRAELEPGLHARLAGALASARVATGDVEGALTVLREILPTLESAEQRRSLYLLAGELLESIGRFEAAVDAYGGRI